MKAVEKNARGEMIDEAGETEGARRATGVFPAGAPAMGEGAAGRLEVEVVAQAERRRFTAEYKRRIVREADRCTKPGEIGALLRREGLYSSHLVTWRAARDRGELEGLRPKKRGPKVAPPDPRDKKIAEEKAIEQAVEGRTGTKRSVLRKLVKDARVLRTGEGKRGDPSVYRIDFGPTADPRKILVPLFPIYVGNKKTRNPSLPKT